MDGGLKMFIILMTTWAVGLFSALLICIHVSPMIRYPISILTGFCFGFFSLRLAKWVGGNNGE